MYIDRGSYSNVRGLAALLLACASSIQLAGQNIDLSLTQAQHQRLEVSKNIQRLAVGDGNRLSAELLNNRELLLLGNAAGRTSLLIWFTDGSLQEYVCDIHRDFSVLQAALTRIHPSIRIDVAPDRDAIVLTGTVPDINIRNSAESIAQSYLEAGPADGRLLLPNEQAGTAQTAQPQPQQPAATPPAIATPSVQVTVNDAGRPSAPVRPTGRVIDLIIVQTLPLSPEQKILGAIGNIGGARVTLRRIIKGDVRDDTRDLLVLEGKAPNQIALTRILTVASEIFTGQTTGTESIQVLADESGALSGGITGGGGSGGGNSGGGGIDGGGGRLNNQVSRNIARAKVVQAGGGRVLSFIEVADIPQVRVGIRLFEIDRSKLLSYNPNVSTILGSPKVGALNPSQISQSLQGKTPPAVGPGNAVQSVLGFLGGTLTNETQLTAGHFALDAVLSYLQQQGIARSLSSPSLTVLSGENARFQVGGDIPVPQVTTTGTSLAVFSSVQFLNYGIQLNIRPLVGDDDVLTLDVAPTVTTPDTALTASIQASTGTNQQTIAFKSRSLQTSARLQDGQALLIGGLLTKDTNDTTASTPGLRDVPGLGWLFKNLNRTDDTTELIVVVNPAIVRDPSPNINLWEYPGASELMETFAKSAINKAPGNSILPAGVPPGK
jgi:pilus assembly protein CpaC